MIRVVVRHFKSMLRVKFSNINVRLPVFVLKHLVLLQLYPHYSDLDAFAQLSDLYLVSLIASCVSVRFIVCIDFIQV